MLTGAVSFASWLLFSLQLFGGGGQEPRLFLLPYPVGDSARLIQGNNGRWGHQEHAAFAFDFVMPIGSPVTAAGPGQVVAVEERYTDGNRTSGEENFVVIRHGDSTFTRYYHLTRDGALVDVGSYVAAGDTIGRSGDTGASAGPHLHFDATAGCFDWGCQTIEIRFANADREITEGETHWALPVNDGVSPRAPATRPGTLPPGRPSPPGAREARTPAWPPAPGRA